MREGLLGIFLVAFALFFSNVVLAAPTNLYWHSNDYYSIELSGSGNAFVVGTISLEALTQTPVNSIVLEVPYTGITLYKVVEDGRYVRQPCIQIPCQAGQACPPCYPQDVYQPSAFLNYTTQSLSDSTILGINLVYPIQNDTTTILYLIFSTKGVAEKNFQGFSFNFRTVEDPNALIRALSADVIVPQNMYLKGKPSFDIKYKPSDIAAQALTSNAESIAGTFRSYPYYGGGQFTANNLQPGESFTVSGLYGDSLILLYAQEIALGVLGFIVVVIFLNYFVADKLRGMFSRREGEERISRRQTGFSFGRALVVGFVSSLLFIAVYYLLNIIFSNNYYNSPIGTITLLVLNGVFVLLSLFGFPYFLYSQYNKTEGFVAGIISLVIGFVLLFLLLPQYSPPVIYAALQGAKTAVASVGTAASSVPNVTAQ